MDINRSGVELSRSVFFDGLTISRWRRVNRRAFGDVQRGEYSGARGTFTARDKVDALDAAGGRAVIGPVGAGC